MCAQRAQTGRDTTQHQEASDAVQPELVLDSIFRMCGEAHGGERLSLVSLAEDSFTSCSGRCSSSAEALWLQRSAESSEPPRNYPAEESSSRAERSQAKPSNDQQSQAAFQGSLRPVLASCAQRRTLLVALLPHHMMQRNASTIEFRDKFCVHKRRFAPPL